MSNRIDCTCGSGGHPRKCEKHPLGYDFHRFDMITDNLWQMINDLEEVVEKLENRIKILETKS